MPKKNSGEKKPLRVREEEKRFFFVKAKHLSSKYANQEKESYIINNLFNY